MRKFLLGFAVGILTIPAGAFAAAWLGWLPTNANAAPSKLEKAFAHLALDSAAARRAPHLANPIAPTEENLMAGLKLFKGDCAGCHGDPNNAANHETEPILYPNPPVFALHPPRKPDYQLFWIIKGGVRYSGMFWWDVQFGKDASGKDISDEKIWTAVTFLTHLDSLPPRRRGGMAQEKPKLSRTRPASSGHGYRTANEMASCIGRRKLERPG